MPFEIGGICRSIAIASLFAWSLSGAARAEGPETTQSFAGPPEHPDARAHPTDASEALESKPEEVDALTSPPDDTDAFADPADPLRAFESPRDVLARHRTRHEGLTFEPLRLGDFSIGKGGVVYRNTMLMGRRELPFRVWAGRKRKQLTLGVDLEPVLRSQKLRVSAYGSPLGFGFAMRLRY